ncbi:hypothetical protein ACFE04_015748 [Oxalis oulophora]
MIAVDRLSNLPDEVLTRILCGMEIQHAIRTSVLSKRWNRLWTQLSSLFINADSFNDLDAFQFFLLRLLVHYDASKLCSLTLTCSDPELDDRLVTAIIDYATANGVEHVWISVPNITPFQLFKLSKAYFTLEDLTLGDMTLEFPIPLIFACLTSILLYGVTVKNNEISLHCENLEKFCMTDCSVTGLSKINIFSPQLVKLDIQFKRLDESPETMRVVLTTPKLKSLSFEFECESYINVILLGCLTLDSVSIDFYNNFALENKEDVLQRCKHAMNLIVFLKALGKVKSLTSLTLSVGIIKLLAVFSELLKTMPSRFHNLKCLKVHKNSGNQSIIITPEVETFLVGGCPNGPEILKGLREGKTEVYAVNVERLFC